MEKSGGGRIILIGSGGFEEEAVTRWWRVGLMAGLLAVAPLSVPGPAAETPAPPAGAPKALGRFEGWVAFRVDRDGQQVCYAAAQPARWRDSDRTAPPWLLVIRWPGRQMTGAVKVAPGHGFRPGSIARLQVDDRDPVTLLTFGDAAWPWARHEGALLAAMAAGERVRIEGLDAAGRRRSDTYRLDGFAAAWARVLETCP